MARVTEPGHVERIVTRDVEDQVGKPLSQRARQAQRSVETYLAGGVRPRWMERLVDVEAGYKRAARQLGRERDALRARLGAEAFAARWRAVAAEAPQRFAEHNELVAQHNAWYPIERDLPMDPRTQDYVLIQGRSYRREPIDAAWVLERFPAE
jgi:hypothetical protein